MGAMRLATFMKSSNFRVVPLATEIAEAARRDAESGRSDHALITVNSPTGFPCRHCLRWATPGEHVVLFPYAAIPTGLPYSEIGPIFVHAQSCQRYAATTEYPEQFRRGRVFRAYNSGCDIIDAQIVNGEEPEAVIATLLENSETAFVHVRSATHGCYTFQVERA
jgi:hypothetical protein